MCYMATGISCRNSNKIKDKQKDRKVKYPYPANEKQLD